MATLGLVVAQDLINTTLIEYERGDALFQTISKRPYLAALREKQKTFASGQQTISIAVQGTKMSDIQGFIQGYSNDDQLNFSQSQFVQRCTYPWKEIHAGLIITFTELKLDGITVKKDKSFSQHSGSELNQLVKLAANRKNDFDESWATGINQMLYQDGSQDAKQVPGLASIFTDTPGTGTTGGISRSQYAWWNHFAAVGSAKILASKANQTLSQYLIDLVPQLMKFGGQPNRWFYGSGFLSALQQEMREKGLLTMTNWDGKSATNIGMAAPTLPGVGAGVFDPTLDLIGWAKRCVIYDDRRFKLMPEDEEDDRTLMPERPYNYMVWMMSKTMTAGLVCDQLNANAIVEVA